MFIIGLILLVVAFMLHKHFHEDDKLRVDNGPKLTPDQKKANYQSVRRFVENNPDMQFCKDKLPEYVEDIEFTHRYTELDRKLLEGELSWADYQIELDQLTKNIKFKL